MLFKAFLWCHLWDVPTNNADARIKNLAVFYYYFAGSQLVSAFVTGTMAVMGSDASWFLLVTAATACLSNLVHSLSFLVLALYVGLDDGAGRVRNTALGLLALAAMQLAGLFLIISLCGDRWRQRQAARAALHRVKRIPNTSPSTPLLVP